MFRPFSAIFREAFNKENCDSGYLYIKCAVKMKVNVKQSNYRPGQAVEGSRRLRIPDFKRVDT